MKPLTLATVIPWLLRLVAHLVGDFVLTLRREGLVYRVELCEAGEPAPTLTTELRPRSAPAPDPVQLPIPGTDATSPTSPAAVAPPRPTYTDACIAEHMEVGYRYGFARAELAVLGAAVEAEFTERTGLTIKPGDDTVRWTTPTTDARTAARLRVWAHQHGLRVYIDPDDPRPRILTVGKDVWQEHHQGLLAEKYGWGFEGFNLSLRVAIVPPGSDLERILAYAQEHAIDCAEDVAEDGQTPRRPQADELPSATPKRKGRGHATSAPPAKAQAERVVGLTAAPPEPDAKPHRRVAVPEADELARGAPNHRAVGLVRGTWQTVLTRSSSQIATSWSRAIRDRVDAGVRVRAYDRAGRCYWDSLDGGQP